MKEPTFAEIIGLRGLLDLEDSLLEQIRQYQKPGLSPRRNVGGTVTEYRQILEARLNQLTQAHALSNDAAITVLYVAQRYSKGQDGNVSISTVILGMVTFQLIVSQSFTSAEILDLFVPERLRDKLGIETRLLKYCHNRLRSMGVTSVRANHPHRRSYRTRERYKNIGYGEMSYLPLQYRFKSEG